MWESAGEFCFELFENLGVGEDVVCYRIESASLNGQGPAVSDCNLTSGDNAIGNGRSRSGSVLCFRKN